MPPALIVADVSVPNTVSVPLELISVVLAEPPEETSNAPFLLSVVVVADPPLKTVKTPPFSTTISLALWLMIENAPEVLLPEIVAEVLVISAAPLFCVTAVALPPACTFNIPPEET